MLQIGDGLDLAEEPLGADDGGELRPKHLDGDLAVVLEVVGEVHGGHAAGAELALDPVAVGHGEGEPVDGVGHDGQWPAPSEIRIGSISQLTASAPPLEEWRH